jgi:hypothetical protein
MGRNRRPGNAIVFSDTTGSITTWVSAFRLRTWGASVRPENPVARGGCAPLQDRAEQRNSAWTHRSLARTESHFLENGHHWTPATER